MGGKRWRKIERRLFRRRENLVMKAKSSFYPIVIMRDTFKSSSLSFFRCPLFTYSGDLCPPSTTETAHWPENGKTI